MAAGVAIVTGLATVLGVLLLGAVAAAPVRAPAIRLRLPRATAPDAAPEARPRRHRRWTVVGWCAVGAIGVLVTGPLITALVAGAGVAWTRRRKRSRDRARRGAIEATLPDIVELLVLCVHAGRSPAQAVVEAARRAPPPLADGFAAVELRLRRGRMLADALEALPATLGRPAQELATVVATADREGLPLAPALDRLAADARAARRRLGEAAARRLPVQLSFPLVTCTLPAFVLLAIAPAVLGAISTLRGTAP